MAILILAPSCAAPEYADPQYSAGRGSWPGPSMQPPTLNLSGITAHVDQAGRYELAQLAKMRSIPAARLREAYIQLQQGETYRSISTLNQLVFGNVRHGPAVEAYAYYLRAEAYERQNEIERARFDRERASELAIDEDLRQRLAALTKPAPAKTDDSLLENSQLKLFARSAWSARQPIQSRLEPMGRVYRITVHHTGMSARVGPAQDTGILLNRIQHEHQQGRGWGDIAYHFVIDQSGRIWTARPLRYQGAHAGDNRKNRGNIGISLAGDFRAGPNGQRPTKIQIQALERFLRVLSARYEIGPDDIRTHSHYAITQCPGPAIESSVAQIRRRMAAVATR